MTNRYMNKCSPLPTIRETQIETTVKYLTPVRMAVIKKKKTSVGTDVEKLKPL